MAVGGHGRRELSPGSDLDLVLLGPSRTTSLMADALWYPVWDSGIRLDHSVRTVDQAVDLARDDVKAALGLLDLRVVAGDEQTAGLLRERALAQWRATAARHLPELRAMGERRAQRYGDVASLLEPDLKESYGGLREATVLRAITASWVTDVPHGTAEAAHAHLLDVRDALHRTTGRGTDRLTMQEQGAVAALLGLPDADALLRSVCADGRAIAYAIDDAWYRVERALLPRRSWRPGRRSGASPRRPLDDGIVEQDGEAVLAREADLADPTLALRTAAAAAQHGLRLPPLTVHRLATEGAPLTAPWPRPAREALVSLLGAGRSALPVWEALDQAGLWGRWIEGWDRLRALPQRNPVHRFTVDRHLVEAALQAAALTRRVDRPDLLLVGALLHDVGKGLPGDHTDEGVRLVQRIAPQLGFDADDTAVLVALCRYHLLLPDTATRRDPDDPSTVESVVAAVGDARFLDLLAALTEADARATGPAAWTEWRAALVEDLVARAHHALRGSPLEPEPAPVERDRALVEAPGLHVVVEEREHVWRVVVVGDDRPGLMADVAGVLSVNRLVVRAAALTTVGGRAHQTWTVQPLFGEPPGADVLREDLDAVLAGRVDLAARLARREAAYADDAIPVASPSASVVPGASRDATVIEVRAHDGPALLHRIGRAIASTGAAVRSARVSTMGSDAVDVFYLVDSAGGPLGEQAGEALARTVEEALAPLG